MKKSFKVLEKTEKKQTGHFNLKQDPITLAQKIQERTNYHFFPGKVFEELTRHQVYGYLKDGLYVAYGPVRVSDELRDLMDGDLDFKDYENNFEYRHMNWFQAKRLTQKMGGKMLIPSEYFSILEKIKYQDTTNSVLEDFIKGQEWLDGFVFDDVHGSLGFKHVDINLQTHTKVHPALDKIVESQRHIIHEPESGDWFDWDTILQYVGMPSSKEAKEQIFQFLKDTTVDLHGVKRMPGIKKKHYSISLARDAAHEKSGTVRLCYTPAQIQRLFQDEEEYL